MGFFSRFRKSVEPTPEPEPEQPNATPDEDDQALGWDAISAVFDAAYPGQENPQHWGTLIPWSLGGPDPIRGISAYRGTDPVPHWHYVTYGYSDLFGDQAEEAAERGESVPEWSGYGVEMSLRLVDPAAADPEAAAPTWVLNLLQNLARYVFRSGAVIRAGHYLNANGPIALDEDTDLVGLGFVEDPIHPEPLDTPYGKVQLVQAVGLTAAELDAAAAWNPRGLVAVIGRAHGYGLTVLGRPGIETDPALWQQVQTAIDTEGSTSSFFNVETLRVTPEGDDLVIDLVGGLGLAFRAIASRVARGEPVRMIGNDHVLHFTLQDGGTIRETDGERTTLSLTSEGAAGLRQLPEPPFTLRVDGIPGVVWRVAAAVPA